MADAPDRQRMLRSAFWVGVITLLSRISGLAREAVQASFLGTGLGADAFRIAHLIPNVLRRLVGEGAVSSAFVPVFTRVVRGGDREALRVFAEKFCTLWTIALAAITLCGVALAGGIILGLGSLGAWTPEKVELTASLTRWLFPYLFLISLAAVAGGILNALGLFALPSATSLLYNLAFIALGALLEPYFPGERAAYGFAIGVLAGGLLQLAILLPPLWRLGVRPRPRWPGGHAGVREVLRLLLPASLGAGVYQLNVFVSVLLATSLPGNGPVSALSYAGRLMEFVLGVFVFALSTVSLTTLSVQAAAFDRAGFRSTLVEVLQLTAFITIPSSVGLYVLREPIIDLLLRWGRFGDESAALTAAAFQGYIPGLLFVGLSRVLVSGLYALKDIWMPVKVGAANLVLNAALSWALMDPLGHAGIALASTLAAVAQAASLFWVFGRRERDLLAARALLTSLGRAAAAAAVMGCASWASLGLLLPPRGKLPLALALGAVILGSAALYFAAARLLGAAEVETLWRALRRRRARGPGAGDVTT